MTHTDTQLFYGRTGQLNKLADIAQQESITTPQFVLIGGIAGIGKSELVNQFFQQHTQKEDQILSGKFDENKSSIAYLAIANALNRYSQSLCALPDKEQEICREQIKQRLGNNLAILQQLVPELIPLTNITNEVASISAHEAHNRFLLAINRYLEFIAARHRRLYLFIDDLHWADQESIKLIESILSDEQLSNLIIIGTYRIEETGIGHALSSLMRSTHINKKNIHRIDLEELAIDDVKAIINAMSGLYNSELDELASHLYEKSRGNPLYLHELMMSVLESADYKNTALTCSMALEQLKKTDDSNNIADLLILRMRNISPDSLQLLKLAACMGTIFESKILSAIYKISVNYIDELLLSSIHSGLVKQMETEAGLYYFAHDRVRESAYDLVDDKQSLHLKIGRFFFDQFSHGSNEPRLLDEVVFHMNNGKNLLDDPIEKLSLCECNLKVAVIEKNTGAYKAAINNLRVARSLLPIDSWSKHHALTFQIYINLTEACYLAGKFDEAEELCHLALERTTSADEKLEVYRLKVMELTHISNWSGATSEGLMSLKEQGIDLEDDSTLTTIIAQIDEMEPEQLQNLPVCEDQHTQRLQSLLIAMVSPIYVLRPELMPMLTMTMLKLALDKGNTTESIYAYLIYGMMQGPAMGNYQRADELGKLALRLNRKFNDETIRSKCKLTYATNISPWCHPIKDGLTLLEEGETDGVNAGDIISAGYCSTSATLQILASGRNLADAIQIINEKINFLQTTNNPVAILAIIARQAVLNLQGKIPYAQSLSNNEFDEDATIKQLKENSFYHGIHWYHCCKMQLAVIYNDLDHINDDITESEASLHGALGQFSTADHVFYHSIILGRQYHDQTDAQQQTSLEQLNKNRQQMSSWAQSCPENFQHKHLITEAIHASLHNNTNEAEQHYQTAHDLAIKHGFIQDAAICSEQQAMLHKDNPTQARAYWQQAQQHYQAWGAEQKAEMLANI